MLSSITAMHFCLAKTPRGTARMLLRTLALREPSTLNSNRSSLLTFQHRCASTHTPKIVTIIPQTRSPPPRPAAGGAVLALRGTSSKAPPPPSQFPWKYLIGVLAVTSSVGGIYYYSQKSDEQKSKSVKVNKNESSERAIRRVPATIEEIPETIQYLLVGGGTASFAAFRAIKSNQPKAQILVVTKEDALPYMRPPLSKEIWRDPDLASTDTDQWSFKQWNGNKRSLYYESGAFYTDIPTLTTSENGGVGVARGYTVTRIDPVEHTAVISAPGQKDREIKYGKCLIATGVRPKNISVLEASTPEVRERVNLLRTVRDAERVIKKLDSPSTKDVIVVGGGFLGTELACSLGQKLQGTGKRLRQVYREAGNMAHVLPQYLSHYATEKVTSLGAQVIPETEITRAYMRNGRVALDLSTGNTIEADLVVVGAGSIPNTEMAEASKLEIHESLGGVLVNAELAARTDVYAAGDVACFYDQALGRRRVEHHDHAVVSGRLAGENMAGANPPKHYQHQSMFWSDLGPEVGYEAIGIIDSNLPTVGVFAEVLQEAAIDTKVAKAVTATGEVTEQVTSTGEASKQKVTSAEEVTERVESVQLEEPHSKTSTQKEYDRGVIFYLREKQVVGVLLWNIFNRMHVARQVLSQGEFEDLNEVAKLFNLHQE